MQVDPAPPGLSPVSPEEVTRPDAAGPPLLLRPAGPAGTVVLLHEGFGLTGFVRAMADRFAAEGFGVAAPALFWRDGVLGVAAEAEAGRLARGADPDQMLDDIRAAADLALRMSPGRVVLAGWCFGAAAACLAAMAAPAPFAAVAAWYPVRLRATWETARARGADGTASVPLLVMMGGRDRFLGPDERAWIEAWAAADTNARLSHYPAADHGFCNAARPDLHDAAAAAASMAEALAFLRTAPKDTPCD